MDDKFKRREDASLVKRIDESFWFVVEMRSRKLGRRVGRGRGD